MFRHGEKQKVDSTNVVDKRNTKLTDLGVDQMNKLGEILSKRFPLLKSSKVIYSSPCLRAIQSGEIIKSILNIQNMILVSEFDEFYASDDYKKPKEYREKLFEKAMQDPDWISPETGYSLNQKILEFKNKIKKICLNNQDDLVLISTHGGIVRNTVYNLESKLRPENNIILDSKIHEGGYIVLDFDGENFKVEEFDVYDHLD